MLRDAKVNYTSSHKLVCEDNKHSIEMLDHINKMDQYVILLEEVVNNLSDPTENFWAK